LICSFIPKGNKAIKEANETVHFLTNQIGEFFNRFQANFTSGYGPEDQALNVACTGWDVEPWKTRIESDRIVVSAKLNTQPIVRKDYCGKADGELFKSDPRAIIADPKLKSEVERRLK